MSDSTSFAIELLFTNINLGQTSSAEAWLSADIDGDGYSEIIQPYNNNGNLGLLVYGCVNGALALRYKNANTGQSAAAISWLCGDINGDGCDEVIQLWNNTSNNSRLGMIIYGWVGNALVPIWTSSNVAGAGSGAISWLIGDINHDGRAEILQQWNNNGTLGMIVYSFTAQGMGILWSSANLGEGPGALSWLIGDLKGN